MDNHANSDDGVRHAIARDINRAIQRANRYLNDATPEELTNPANYPEGPGVYRLDPLSDDIPGHYLEAHFLGDPFYVGVAGLSIADRLRHHYQTLTLVDGLAPELISVRTISVPPAAALALEHSLIREFRPVWNDGGGLPGFGSRSPGRGRPGLVASWFHSLHRGHPSFEAIPTHRDRTECLQRLATHFARRRKELGC